MRAPPEWRTPADHKRVASDIHDAMNYGPSRAEVIFVVCMALIVLCGGIAIIAALATP